MVVEKHLNYKVAAVQTDPKILDIDQNLNDILASIKEASLENARLIVFTECALSGYCFDNKQEVQSASIEVSSPYIVKIIGECQKYNVYTVIGFLEKDGSNLFNSSVLLGPEGIIGKYRKNHLPGIGADVYVDKGDIPFKIFDTEIGKIGMTICYDARFPEAYRALTLLGADVIVHPTNSGVGSGFFAEILLPARALENAVYIISADRVGNERGNYFLGRSRIFNHNGISLASANVDSKEIIYANIDIREVRNKRKRIYFPPAVSKPNTTYVDIFDDRRPELYQIITEIVKPL